MPRVLVAFSDRGIERSAQVLPFRGGSEGPLTRYARSLNPGHYDVIWVLTEQRYGEGPARALCRELGAVCPWFEVRVLDVADSSDHGAVLRSLGGTVAEIRALHGPPHGEIDVLLPSDPVTHAVLALLVASRTLPGRALQVLSGGSTDRVVREASFGQLALPELDALREEVAQLRARERLERGLLVGDSEPVRTLRARLARLSRTRFPIVVTGEPGSELEGIARALHGVDASGPFVALSCAFTDERTLMGELLGPHAARGRTASEHEVTRIDRSAYATAHGGTLFIDGAERLPLERLHELVRHARSIEGNGRDVLPLRDVRLVLGWTTRPDATPADKRLFAEARLELGLGLVEVPPLRGRQRDLEALIGYLLVESMGPDRTLEVSRAALDALYHYDFPGNAAELRAEVQRWCATTDAQVTLDALSQAVRRGATGAHDEARGAASTDDESPLHALVQRVERARIERVFERNDQNLSATARALGIDRNTLKRKLKAYRSIDSTGGPNRS